MSSEQNRRKAMGNKIRIIVISSIFALAQLSLAATDEFQDIREKAAPLVQAFDDGRFEKLFHSLQELAGKCRSNEEATKAFVDCLSIALAAERNEAFRVTSTLYSQKTLVSQTEGALSRALFPAKIEDRRELRRKACASIALFLKRLHHEAITGKVPTPPAPTRETIKSTLREGQDLEVAYAEAWRTQNAIMKKLSDSEMRRQTVPEVLTYSFGYFEKILAGSRENLTVEDTEALIRQSGVPDDQVEAILNRVRK